MIAVDTNVMVRYLAQDDPAQSAVATEFIESTVSRSVPGFISLVVLVELCWVLKRLYAESQSDLLGTVADLLSAAHFEIERRAVVQSALQPRFSIRRTCGAARPLPTHLGSLSTLFVANSKAI